MSPRARNQVAQKATLFAALGDETRLELLAKLGGGEQQSITELTAGTSLTRQAVTKHLRVLQQARVVHARRAGRESLFALNPASIEEAALYLEQVSKRWGDALERLKRFAETDVD
jgi:DNA-binding transcriptional ArsR family regulator